MKDPSFVNINHNRLVNRLSKTSRLFLDCAAAVNFDASQKDNVEYLQLLLYYKLGTFFVCIYDLSCLYLQTPLCCSVYFLPILNCCSYCYALTFPVKE